MVAKAGGKVYVTSISTIYYYFSFVFFIKPKKVELLKISKVM